MSDQTVPLLVSHSLCPYVQRAVISLTEKAVPFTRLDIDLSAKPDWFLKFSPTGRTPLLVVDGGSIFESNVILEYLEETQPNPLHPSDPLERARHRGWLEFASAILNDIAGLYTAGSEHGYFAKANTLRARFQKVEEALGESPYFEGEMFSLVDAAFGPVFRYFDVFEKITSIPIFSDLPKTCSWRQHLAERPSVRNAVAETYAENLLIFLRQKDSFLGALARQAFYTTDACV